MLRNHEEFASHLREVYSLENEQVSAILNIQARLEAGNRRHNLVSRRDVNSVWITMVFDSLSVRTYLPSTGDVLDVGSGAGIPGLILAVTQPNLQFTLAERVGKKAKTLESIRIGCRLKNVTIWPRSVEELEGHTFDAITARAVAPLPLLWESIRGVTKPGTRLALFRGSRELEENPTTPEGVKMVRLEQLGGIALWVADVVESF